MTAGNISYLFAVFVTRVRFEHTNHVHYMHTHIHTHTHLCLIWRRSSPKDCQHHFEDACRIIVQHKQISFIPPTTTCPETPPACPRNGEKTVATSSYGTETSSSCKSAFGNPTGPCASNLATTSCTPPTGAAAAAAGRHRTASFARLLLTMHSDNAGHQCLEYREKQDPNGKQEWQKES